MPPAHATEDAIDRLYRIALLISSSPDEASALVVETCRRASDLGLAKDDPYALLRQLWSVHKARHREIPGNAPIEDEPPRDTRMDAALKDARETVAKVFHDLSPETQSVILLRTVEGMTPVEVARTVELEETSVRRMEEKAVAAFKDALFSDASEWQRDRLIRDLPESWIGDSLSHVAEELGRAPEELRRRLTFASEASTPATLPPVSGPTIDRRPKPRPLRPTIIRARSLALAVVMILVVGFGARFVYDRFSSAPDNNVITLVATAATHFSPDLQTDSVDRIRRFLLTHFQDGTPMPLIEGARLEGAGIEEIAPNVRVIAIRFSDMVSNRPVTVYSFSYRFLEGQSSVQLPNDVLRQIQSDADFDLHNLGDNQVLVWRHRAHIFLAVTELDGRELRARIYYPDFSNAD